MKNEKHRPRRRRPRGRRGSSKVAVADQKKETPQNPEGASDFKVQSRTQEMIKMLMSELVKIEQKYPHPITLSDRASVLRATAECLALTSSLMIKHHDRFQLQDAKQAIVFAAASLVFACSHP